MEPFLPYTPPLIAEKIKEDRRVLLFGESGIGKSTLAALLAGELAKAGNSCLCLNADPGSPSFGAPGAVSLGKWADDTWQPLRLEALCTLDSGRFRLPLVLAAHRLAAGTEQETLLVDAPGIVRSVAGAELLAGLTAALRIDIVLVLANPDKQPPLASELAASGCEVLYIEPSSGARLPSKRKRSRRRTRLWDEYLHNAVPRTIPFSRTMLNGTPPPLERKEAWPGRQIALLKDGATLGMGEILGIDRHFLEIRIGEIEKHPDQILVRDAGRDKKGLLTTARPAGRAAPGGIPPPDLAPCQDTEKSTGPRPMVRIGDATGILINGVFGDPLLHLRFHNRKRSILLDIGEGVRLPARLAHQVSDVLVSHAHFDHISGFLWLLRSRIGVLQPCRLFGPPGLADRILNMIKAIHWDRIGEEGPRFEVGELHDGHLLFFRLQAGHADKKPFGERDAPEGILFEDPDCLVRAVTLQHGTIPSVAYCIELAPKFNVIRESLRERNLAPGPWLGKLKKHLAADQHQATIHLPDGSTATAGLLADEFMRVTPSRKLVYATDFSDTVSNRDQLIPFAGEADIFFCEAGFREQDREYAELSGHLTTHGCGEIARAAGVKQLVPFHFSRRYEQNLQDISDEVKEKCAQLRPFAIP